MTVDSGCMAFGCFEPGPIPVDGVTIYVAGEPQQVVVGMCPRHAAELLAAVIEEDP